MIFGKKIEVPPIPKPSSKLDDYIKQLRDAEKDRTPEGRLILSAFDLAITAAPLAKDDRFYGIARKTIIDARRLIESAVDGGFLDTPEVEGE